ncbi:MAG: MurR/RpiR family transcriptional regulator [Solobacterium sp.]|nr:MurR/RpiR family transcriptional regulator [Solobacterium sp.]
MNILDRMDLKHNEMTESEKKVFIVIKDDPSFVANYTISQIAMYANTSVSAVLRFCHRLGYKGYKDFRYDVLDYLKQNENDVKETDLISKLSSVFSEAILSLDTIDRSLFDKLAKDILSADKVVLLGRYRNSVNTKKLKMSLTDLGITCLEGNSNLDFQHLLYVIDDKTCVILFSILGDTSDLNDFLEQLSGQTEHTWVITTVSKPKAARYINNVIQIPITYKKNKVHITPHFIVMAFTEILTAYITQIMNEQ